MAPRIEKFQVQDIERLPFLQPEEWPDIRPHFQFYTHADSCVPVKAVYNGEMAGVGAMIRHRSTAWLAHIIVAPQFRNQGIGSAITSFLLSLGKENDTISLVATPLGEPIYQKLGFIKEADYSLYRDGRVLAGDESDVAALDKKQIPEVSRLDVLATGEDRSRLLAPHFTSALTVLRQGIVSGCYFPTLGEGYIVASDTESGSKLMQYKYSRAPAVAFIPSLNEAGIEILKASGFAYNGTRSRMRIGKKLEWNPSMIFGRVGGNLG